MTLDPTTFTVDSLTDAYRSGDLSPVEAAQACLDRIAETEPELNAYVVVDPEFALAAARASEARWQAGEPLSTVDGVPASVKDLVLMRGWANRKGSVHTEADGLATEDAPIAQRLLEAGAVVVGRTTTPEFGWKGVGDSPLTGITRNPWNPALGPGGSSAGAAVAAATGTAVLNVGTDGGGSIRMPAAFCGVFGLKPTIALVPMYPPGGSGLLSHLGPITATVTDAAHMMSIVAVPDSRDIYPTQRDDTSWIDRLDEGVAGLRVAYSRDYGRADVDPQIAAAVERTVSLLSDLGAIVTEVDPGLPDCRDAFISLWDPALARGLAGLSDERLALSDPGLVATMRRGLALSAQQFLDADVVRQQATLAISRLLVDHDVLVSPTLPLTAFAVGSDVADSTTQSHWVDWTPFTYPINMTRHPAAAIPVGLSTDGLPMSMQVVGNHFDDRRVLRVARAVEMAQPFARLPRG